MNKFLVVSAALALALATACSSVPTKDIEILTEAAPKANFSGYSSYAWLGAATMLNDPDGQWESPEFDADTEIKYLIDRELRARGFSETTTDPDMVIAFAAGVDMDALQLKTDPETDLDVLTNVPSSGLMIIVVDAKSGFVIWAGVASPDMTASRMR